MTGCFFQIDQQSWQRVVACGLNASIAYLVLACGTGRDNRTTAWSVNSIEKYTGIGRTMAKQAIDALEKIGAVTRVEGAKPLYRIEPPSNEVTGEVLEPRWIWLPNTLVTGAMGEPSPIERVRRLQDVMVLEHLISLYDIQDLAENGGIWWRYIRRSYTRTRITERGIWNIWGFDRGSDGVWPNTPVIAIFERDFAGRLGRKEIFEKFWASWNALTKIGLIECIPHLVEADNNEAVIVYPCPSEADHGTQEERALGELARSHAVRLLGDFMENQVDAYEVAVPVPDNFPAVELVGVFRLRYRPHTRKTAAWYAKSQNEAWRKRLGGDVQHQG
ncbi:MAG: hypothetical protein RL702_2792 [Pseudomonadota bacterium]|jgi:hypothetical protein